MIADIIFNLPLDRTFHYTVPAACASLQPGMRVLAPFGHRRLVGYCRGLPARSEVPGLKPILRILDERPVLTDEQLRLAEWVSAYYGCSIGEACAAIVPTAFRVRHEAIGDPADTASESGPELTAQQRDAFARLQEPLGAGRHETFLLHGVTGSGKTELYLRAIADVLAQDRGAICLVPEIALTPQTIDRFRERFGEQVALWHSRLTAAQRAAEWQRLRSGRRRIVVGTRSAIFAPLERIGLIILDEEHDGSYKQDSTPRYHARDVAIARAQLHQAVVILGSATPSLESYYLAQTGRYQRLELTQRVHGRPMPEIEIVDMRQEFNRGRRLMPLSLRLETALRRIVEQKEQAILLLNRRGFARVITCPQCGWVVRCTDCAVPLIYHARPARLQCHYCGAQQPPIDLCPGCRKGYLRFRGTGTERVESELSRIFPESEVGRMDADSTKGRDSHRQFYDALRTQRIQMLVGTQMVAKGLDIPQVTLVGVVSADTALNLPDFRAGERTFDLLTQVAGRAGRGDRPGQVLIQTYCPEHYTIQAASRHDYRQFYEAELATRRQLRLPPFSHLIELTVEGRKPETVREAAFELAAAMKAATPHPPLHVLGPAPHRIETIRKIVRWRLILKVSHVEPMIAFLKGVLGEGRRFRGLTVTIDVDPQ